MERANLFSAESGENVVFKWKSGKFVGIWWKVGKLFDLHKKWEKCCILNLFDLQ